MTQDAGFKKAVRARMAETGEKYTEARRALLAADGRESFADVANPASEPPPPTWALIRELLNEPLRTPAWRRAAGWAIDALEEDLGPDWPADAVRRFGTLPIPLVLIGGHTLAFVQSVELALRVRLLRSTKGFARTRAERRGDPELARILHFSLQAALGALGTTLGWDVHLEPGHPPADLWFDAGGERVSVEAKVLKPSELALDHHDNVDRVMRSIRDAAVTRGVWVYGSITVVPSNVALQDVIDWISLSARFVRGGGAVTPYRQPGFDLDLVPQEDGQGHRLIGPAGREELLPRFVRTLNDKAGRMLSSGAGWLCVEDLTGLFGFTEWAQLDMPRKVSMLEGAIAEGLRRDTIRGVVVCSGVSLFQGTVNEEVAETDGGSIGLRYPVIPLRAREVVIVALSEGASLAAQHWKTLFESERDWFTRALHDAGLPTFDEIVGETGDAPSFGANQ